MTRSRLVSMLFIPALVLSASIAMGQATGTVDGQPNAPGVRNLYWQPDQPQQGSPLFFTLELDSPARRVTATWIDKPVRFFKSDKPGIWYALAGADLGVKPGNYDIRVEVLMAGGRVAHEVKTIAIAAANFGSGTANVAEQYVKPNALQEKIIRRDEVLKRRAFAHFTPRPLWSGDFIKPVDAPSTPSFGETRRLNGEITEAHHLGTDFPIKEGSPVRVSNSGIVVLATHLYMEGNCIFVDHGDRFFTVYLHLSKIDVHYGEHLRKGQLIGLSGATGRVTGPHLHMGAEWSGAWVDPVQLLKLTLPDLGATAAR